jgi:2-methylcitrate dehydratase PrpD
MDAQTEALAVLRAAKVEREAAEEAAEAAVSAFYAAIRAAHAAKVPVPTLEAETGLKRAMVYRIVQGKVKARG